MTEATQTIQDRMQFLKEETKELIREWEEDNQFAVDDMIEFIFEWDEDDFRNHYEKYVELGESYSYEAVDYFINENSVDDIEKFEDAYMGTYSKFRDFVEEMFLQTYNVPEDVQQYLDWGYIESEYEYDYVFDRNSYSVFSRHF